MSRIYKGRVSVFADTKNQLVVRADQNGQFSHENVAELYQKMVLLSKQHKMEIRVYKPESLGDTPVLLADRWGKPYVALLRADKAPGPLVTTKRVQKLA